MGDHDFRRKPAKHQPKVNHFATAMCTERVISFAPWFMVILFNILTNEAIIDYNPAISSKCIQLMDGIRAQ